MRNDYPDIIGKVITGIIDRPIGSSHPSFSETIYPVNYGYASGYLAEDGEFQDVYLLGAENPAEHFKGRVIAVYRRDNDIEDKWIVTADGQNYPDEAILDQISFQEQYFPGKLLR